MGGETFVDAERHGADRSLAAKVVQMLFDRQKVPDRKRSRAVEEVLGISYQAAHRRVSGDGPWSLDELEQLAAHYGESLANLFQSLHLQGAVDATFVAGMFRYPCKAWLGEPTDPSNPTALVARQEGLDWIVTPAGDLPAPNWSVRTVTLESRPAKRFRIAIVDDEMESVEGACAYLTEVGFEAHPFVSFSAMRDAMTTIHFDAYILDWLVGPETALQTIATLRASDFLGPIGVLTGQIQTGRVQPSDVASAIKEYGVAVPFEKPLRAPILEAWLHQALVPGS